MATLYANLCCVNVNVEVVVSCSLLLSMLLIRRGKRDHLGINFHNTPLTYIVALIRTVSSRRF